MFMLVYKIYIDGIYVYLYSECKDSHHFEDFFHICTSSNWFQHSIYSSNTSAKSEKVE